MHLPPVRNHFQNLHGCKPDKDEVIAVFDKKEAEVRAILRNEQKTDQDRYNQGINRWAQTTYDPHDEDHRATFKIALRTWMCSCWPPNGWYNDP